MSLAPLCEKQGNMDDVIAIAHKKHPAVRLIDPYADPYTLTLLAVVALARLHHQVTLASGQSDLSIT